MLAVSHASANPNLPVKGFPHDRSFGWLSVAIVAAYFVVGLWPFDFHPPNRVAWLTGRPGLHFEPYGIAYDPAPLPVPAPSDAVGPAATFTVELWIEPQDGPANAVLDILTIHNPHLPCDFVLGQWKRDFLLRATTYPLHRTGKIPEVGVDHALVKGKAQFITVRSDGTGTDFYLDGTMAGHFPGFILNAEALNGQLILGNSASGKNSWTGRLLGFALYNRALDPADITWRYALWTQGRTGQLTNAPGLTARYFFDEGRGQQAKDSSANRHHLLIPAIFQPVHRDFLIPPWMDLSYNHPDYPDIAVNILGFIPFGFCFFLYRRSLKPKQWVANTTLWVVITGAAISLAIEVTQTWLPNRVSSTTDLLTNTLGTLLGAVLALGIRPKIAEAEAAPESNEGKETVPSR